MRWISLMMLFTLGIATSASAVTDWGTQAFTSTANCPSFCTSFTFGTSGGGFQIGDGSSTVATVQGQADSRATLDASGPISVPVLRARASSLSASLGSGFGDAFAVEGYTYDGVGPATFTVDIDLTGTVSDPSPADGDTSIDARIVLFAETPFFFSSDYGSLVFEAGAVPLDETQMSVTSGSTTGSLSVTLNPGEGFYLWAVLSADAERELSSADAFSTLTMSFRDATGLTASSVPEPGLSLMLASGVLALGMRGRSRGR